LKRARVISAPSKWFIENRHEAFKVAAYKAYHTGITGAIFRLFEPILAKFTWRWSQDIAHQRGLAMEDFLLFQDRELRRCYFFETVARANLHPYTWIFFKRRRARYYKVERGLRGFYVPDWVRKEAENRTLSDSIDNIEEWQNFIYKEYMSEMTPSTRWSVLNKWNVLDMFLPQGIMRVDSWDRFFYNEAFYEETKTKNEVK